MMKVKIGKCPNWWGPYQIADLLQKVGVSEDTCYAIGDRLADTWLLPVCEWIHSKQKRTEKIRIDRWDTWSADHTLSLIIVPLLEQLRDRKQGAPFVDDEDVPEELRSTSARPMTEEERNNGGVDEFHFKRWDWIIDEMIWAFTQIRDDEWEKQFFVNGKYLKEEHRAYLDRIRQGTTLFGKYFQGLWV
jgi:hypothetical protein